MIAPIILPSRPHTCQASPPSVTGCSGKVASWFISDFCLGSACPIKLLPQRVSVSARAMAHPQNLMGCDTGGMSGEWQPRIWKKQLHCSDNHLLSGGVMTWTEAGNGSGRKKPSFLGQQVYSLCILGLISLSLLTHNWDQWSLNFSGHRNHSRKPSNCSATSEWGAGGSAHQVILMQEHLGPHFLLWYHFSKYYWLRTLQFILHEVFKTDNLYPLTLVHIFTKWFLYSLACHSETNQCRGVCVCVCVYVLKNKG